MALTLDGTNGLTFNDSSLQGAAASPYVLKNRIINGAMVIDQRNAGASVTPTNGQYLVDRFSYATTQTSKVTAAQSSTAPTGFTKSLLFTSSSSYAALAGDLIAFAQAIEGFNTADLAWGTASAKTITLSFQVYSSLTGTFGGCLRNDAGNRFYVFSYSIPVANTWTTISITVAGDTTGTWATDNSAGIRLYFNLGCGTTYSGTAGSWGSTAFYNATGSVNLVATSGATFYITGVQLEVGSTATPFERRLYNQELANCQRYFQQFGGGSSYQYYGTCQATGTTLAYGTVALLVSMRTAPSLSVNSAANFGFTNAANGLLTATAVAMDQAGANACGVSGSVASGLVAGNATRLVANGTLSAQMQFSAEL